MDVINEQAVKDRVPCQNERADENLLHSEGEDINCGLGQTKTKRKPEDYTNKFNHSEVFRLRHQLVVTLEEVKLRKECEDRHDMKIKELLSQVYELEKGKDSLQHQLKQEEARFNSAIAQVKQIREEQENPSKHQQETNGRAALRDDILKEEARKLQLLNFQQENTIKTLEAKLQSQASSSHQVMTQMLNFEEKLSTVTKLYQETNAYIGRLEATVKHQRHG